MNPDLLAGIEDPNLSSPEDPSYFQNLFVEPPLDDIAQADLAAAHERLGAALPKGGWLEAFVKTILPVSVTPTEFSIISGMGVLASVYGHRVYKTRNGLEVYPHIWAVIVARSGYLRKSSSVKYGLRLLNSAGCKDLIMPSNFTPEALVTMLSERPCGIAPVDEFGDILALMNKDYSKNLKSLMCTIWDGNAGYASTRVGGTGGSFSHTALTTIAATTIENMEGNLTRTDFQSGFLPRFIYILSDVRNQEHFEDPDNPEAGRMSTLMTNRLVAGLARLRKVGPQWMYSKGKTAEPIVAVEVRYDRDAQELYNEWLRGWEREAIGDINAQTHAIDMSGFAIRMQAYVDKFAMLYRASACAFDERLDPLQIDRASVESAIAYVRILWANTVEIMSQRIAFSQTEVGLRRVLEVVGKGSWWGPALKAFKLGKKEFDPLVQTHLETEALVLDHHPGATPNAQAKRYLRYGPNHPNAAKWDAEQAKPEAAVKAKEAAAERQMLRSLEPGFVVDAEPTQNDCVA